MANEREGRFWQLAQCRIESDELRYWHKAARRADLSLSQAMRKAMRRFAAEVFEQDPPRFSAAHKPD
jgi:hypothetical protein